MRKMKNIYEHLCNYTEKEIDDLISHLSVKDQMLIKARYGDDLHNPVTSVDFTKTERNNFYSHLIPKMRLLLAERKLSRLESVSLKGTELRRDLIELIKINKSNKEICDSLNLNSKQLYDLLIELKSIGVFVSRKYYSDGSIKYKRVNSFAELKKANLFDQDRTLITDHREHKIKFLVISDLHFGNQLERLDLINRAYNYCTKNGINIILSGGDLIDGTYTKGSQKISDVYEQLEYFIKNYPHDENILTFSVAGDHDLSAFVTNSFNMVEMCNNYRHDIIIGGYNNTGINLKNDQILLSHKTDANYTRKTNAPLILHGHLHRYTTYMEDNTLNVTIPSLSGIIHPMPSALELNLSFNKGYIEDVVIKQLYFADKDIILNESKFDLLKDRTVFAEPTRNIENFKESNESEDLDVKQKSLSQIEKFNKRYGI